MTQWKEVGKSVARVFLGTMLAAIVAALGNAVNIWSLDWAVWQPIVAGAVIAAATVVVNALNQSDARYGIGASDQT